MLETYQYIPEHINPIAVSIGSFSVKWYSIMYLVAFAIVYFLLSHRIRKKENLFEINKNQLTDLLIYLIIGLLLGARLGYVIFYDFSYYFNNPFEILLPFKITDYKLLVTGYYGMSYFGGLIGVVLSGVLFSKRNKVDFWQLADFVIPAIPAGYFFGRIGNFLNGELYGRVTDVPWGMYFLAGNPGLLRHPSQLYEAFFEGLVLFLILWLLRNKKMFHVSCFMLYIFGYGLFRFFVEFFREPDPQIGLIFNFITRGQAFSLFMVSGVLFVYFWRKNRKML